MSTIENQVKTLALGFFSKINAIVIEKNELFDIDIPDNYSKLFGTNHLKIVFNDKILKPDDYELLSPGSNILFKILNTCIDFGPFIIGKNCVTDYNSIIRFYFYVVFESITTKTKLCSVDVDVKTKNIILDNLKIDYNASLNSITFSSDDVDDCYIAASDYVEKITKPEISEFKNHIYEIKNKELINISNEYDKRFNDVQEQLVKLQSAGASLDDLIFKNQSLKNEKHTLLENLDVKFRIIVDFALIAAIVIV